MDTEYFKNGTNVLCRKIRKRILSKKFLLISCVSSILLLTLYVGSYRHFRNNSIEFGEKIKDVKPKDIRNIHIPSGYYLGIVFGIGLSSHNMPPRGCSVHPIWYDEQNNPELCKWMYYLYYPLIQLEIKIWRIKIFGW
jgi:hypothetical protein